MTSTILAVDIGNSTVVLGLFRGETLAGEWRFASDAAMPLRQIQEHLRLFAAEAGIGPRGQVRTGISSVVPALTKRFTSALRRSFGSVPIVISGRMALPLKLRYRQPQTLGADRICAVAAALRRYGGPAIVIDLGTATTLDVLSRRGEYRGGVIAPGFGLLASALRARTAQLPEVSLRYPGSVAGTSTEECIQSGVMFGGLEMVEGLARRLRASVAPGARIIVTGGYARLFADKSTLRPTVDPTLVLDGIRLLCEAVSRRGR